MSATKIFVRGLLLAALAMGGCGDGVAGDKPCSLDTTTADCAASCSSDRACRFDPLCVDGHWRYDCTPRDMAVAPSCSLATVSADCAASCGAPDGGLGPPGGAGWPCEPDPVCIAGGRWRFDCIR